MTLKASFHNVSSSISGLSILMHGFISLPDGTSHDKFIYRVGIKPGFYHKAQPGGFYGFYEGGFWGFYGFYVGFINLKVYLKTPATTCYLTVFLCKQHWSKEKQPYQD